MSEGQVKESGPRVAGGDPGNETVVAGEADSQRSTRVRLEQTPEAMREPRQWADWGEIDADGEVSKRPINPRTGRNASSTDPSTWGTLEEALAGVERFGLVGIGFVMTSADGLVGIDLDHCINGDGEIADWAAKIVRDCASYTERSPSGTGLRIFVRGTWPTDGNHSGNLEVYEAKHFLSFTGSRLEDSPTTVNEAQEALDRLWEDLSTGDPSKTVEVGDLILDPAAEPPRLKHVHLLETVPRYRSTWSQTRRDLSSLSESDLALANFTVQDGWTNQEIANTLIAFRREHGDRDDLQKALRADYVGRTIGAARGGYLRRGPELLGTDVIRIVQFGREQPSCTLVLPDGIEITNLGLESILNHGAMERILFAQGIRIGASAKKQWETVKDYLLSRVVRKEGPTMRELTEDWLNDLLDIHSHPGGVQLICEENPQEDALAWTDLAVDLEGRMFVHLGERIGDDAKRRFGTNTDYKKIGELLSACGFERRRLRVNVERGERAARKQRRFWESGTGLVDPETVRGLFQEKETEEMSRVDASRRPDASTKGRGPSLRVDLSAGPRRSGAEDAPSGVFDDDRYRLPWEKGEAS